LEIVGLCNRDPIFGSFELILEREEVRRRSELRVLLCDREESPD